MEYKREVLEQKKESYDTILETKLKDSPVCEKEKQPLLIFLLRKIENCNSELTELSYEILNKVSEIYSDTECQEVLDKEPRKDSYDVVTSLASIFDKLNSNIILLRQIKNKLSDLV
jgi:hypothetical protein